MNIEKYSIFFLHNVDIFLLVFLEMFLGNQLNQTIQSKVLIVLCEHTFETLIWSLSSWPTLLMMYL
jgi:hypothetical protein